MSSTANTGVRAGSGSGDDTKELELEPRVIQNQIRLPRKHRAPETSGGLYCQCYKRQVEGHTEA